MTSTNTTVVLRNCIDQSLARSGKLASEHVRQIRVDAVADFGILHSFLPESVAEKLGLRRYRRQYVTMPNGEDRASDLAGIVEFELLGRATGMDAVIYGNRVIVGQMVLRSLDLVVDSETNEVRFNPKHGGKWVTRV